MCPRSRRAVLGSFALAVGGLAGCTAQSPRAEPAPQQVENCPEQEVPVKWPDELTSESAGEFVAEFDAAYVEEHELDFEPRTRLDGLEHGSSAQDVEPEEAGYVVEVIGNARMFEPVFVIGAEPVDDADGLVHDVAEIGDEDLRTFVASAVDEKRDETVSPRERVDRYVAELETFPEVGTIRIFQTERLFFDVDSEVVTLTATANNHHAERDWEAFYYVDENVLRRSQFPAMASEGEVVACRET